MIIFLYYEHCTYGHLKLIDWTDLTWMIKYVFLVLIYHHIIKLLYHYITILLVELIFHAAGSSYYWCMISKASVFTSAYGLKNLRGIPFQFQVRREFKSDGNTSKGGSRRREKIIMSCWWWWGPSLPLPRLPLTPLPPVALAVVWVVVVNQKIDVAISNSFHVVFCQIVVHIPNFIQIGQKT